MNRKNILLLVLGALIFTSCVRNISSNAYSGRQVGEVSVTYAGVVRSVREVCVEGDPGSGAGLVGGGLAGGLLGSAMGSGNFIPTAAGAVVGAVAGSAIENKMTTQAGVEYIVELTNGDLITVVQGLDIIFNVGEPVYVMVSPSGRSRVVPQ